MSADNVIETRQYDAGTVACYRSRVLALRDLEAGKLWICVADFLQKNADWVCPHPCYFQVPDLPLATVNQECGEVFFVGGEELTALLGCTFEGFELAPHPAAAKVSAN